MLILRLFAIIAVLAIVANVGLWLFTREQRYLSWAWHIGKATLFATLALLLLLVAERLIVLL